MNILYIGFAVDRKYETRYEGISVAGNKMQVNFLKELNSIMSNENLTVVSIFPVAAYPRDKVIIINREKVEIDEKSGLNGYVPFILNFPIIKNLYEIVSTYRVSIKIAQNSEVEKVVIFNAFPQTAYAALKLKRLLGCEVICLLADLPLDDSIKTRGLQHLLRNIFDRYTKRAIKKMDKLIVLNKQAAQDYAPDVPYMVMEGAVSAEDIRPFIWTNHKEHNIVFTGSLQKHNGIVELVESVKRLKDTDICLDIYGDGEFRDYVKENAAANSCIHYHGKVLNKEVQAKQREAFLLVNPRPIDNYISQVTFPSKIFEYMMSGTPVLTTKLNGFTEDYMDTMFFIDDNAPKTIELAVRYILALDEATLKDLAQKAYNLVTEKKNWHVQTQSMYNFIGRN